MLNFTRYSHSLKKSTTWQSWLMVFGVGTLSLTVDQAAAQFHANKEGRTPYPQEKIRLIAKEVRADGWIVFKDNLKDKPQEIASKHKEALGLGSTDELKSTESLTDELNITRYRYTQHHAGVPIEGADFSIYAKEGHASHATGRLVQVLGASQKPAITESQAFAIALRNVPATLYAWQDQWREEQLRLEKHNPSATSLPKGELLYALTTNDADAPDAIHRLAYRFDIRRLTPEAHEAVYVDALTGRLLRVMSLIANSSCQFGNQVNTWYNGNNILGTWWDSSRNRYQLKDYCRTSYILTKYSDGNGSSDWDNQNSYYIEASGSEGSPQNTNWNWDFKARSAASAHFGMQTAHYYFKTTFNRNGAYGDGRELRVLVNNYRNNAFYDMYNGNDYITVGRNYDFGPADERSFAELDVMAHEFTHGVVRGSANLQLSGESFALNESFADIFGEMTERLHTGQHNWTVLQGIGVPRVMAEEEGPSFAGLNQPAQIYQGRGWDFVRAEPHQNGGVQNRWFYFLSVGTGPRDFNVTVNGIGEEKAQRIAYRSLTRYLNSTSDYNHARVSAIQAATDIYGACSAEVTATTNAWAAVGLGAAAPEFCAAEITGQRRFCTEDGTSVYNEYRVQASPGATKTWSNSNGLFDFSPLGQTDYTVLSQVPDYDEETTLSVYIEFPANPSANVWRNLTINTEQCRVQCRICPEEAQRALSVDESTKQGMTLYPNPADRSITVDFTSASVSARTLNVSDMLGRVLYTQQVPIGQKSVLLDVFQLPAGSFILSVSTPKGTLTKRFLISR